MRLPEPNQTSCNRKVTGYRQVIAVRRGPVRIWLSDVAAFYPCRLDGGQQDRESVGHGPGHG